MLLVHDVKDFNVGDEIYGCVGGLGGVGHIILQLAHYYGTDVYATGGGYKQLKLIEKLGATASNYKTEAVEDYVQKYTNGAGFEVVYNSVGGLT